MGKIKGLLDWWDEFEPPDYDDLMTIFGLKGIRYE
jgi:hypothetical protein